MTGIQTCTNLIVNACALFCVFEFFFQSLASLTIMLFGLIHTEKQALLEKSIDSIKHKFHFIVLSVELSRNVLKTIYDISNKAFHD